MPGATAPTLDEPRTGRLTIQYAPDAETPIVENPPRFTWLPVIEDEALYLLRLSQDPAFPAAETRTHGPVPLNFFTPDRVLEPGTWHWAYAVCDAEGQPVTGWPSASQTA